MRILHLAAKDILQILKDRKTALFLVIMPLLFTVFFGFIFGTGNTDADPLLTIALIDEDNGSELGQALVTLLGSSAGVRPVLLPEPPAYKEEIIGLVRKGEYAAVMIVPQGFHKRLLEGAEAEVSTYVDRGAQGFSTTSQAIEMAINRLLGAVQAGRISAGLVGQWLDLGMATPSPASVQNGATMAVEAWQDPPISVRTIKGSPELEVEPSAFTQSSPGMIVQFTLFGLITTAMVLVLERSSGALHRLLTTPIRRWEVIAGHALAMFLIILIQQAILVLAGQFLFEVDYLRQPLATGVMMVALALWVAGLGMLIATLAGGEEQVITFSILAMLVFSAMGGAWFPLDVAGETFAAIGKIFPSAWAMEGYQNIVLRGLGFTSVLLPAAIVLGYAVLFLGLAVWRFRRILE